MNLVVDASVVVKWFVPEALSQESRALLVPTARLYAPDFLLAEFANTIWKKVRRGDIVEALPYLNELPGLSRLIALQPSGELIRQAARMTLQLDHPVYDCLYLACAEATRSALITADKRLQEKARKGLPSVDVRHVGDPETLRWIGGENRPLSPHPTNNRQ